MTIQEFIDKYREAFGETAPLPIALGYSDTPASEVGSVPKCMIGRISKVRNGDPLEQATPYIKALSHLWGWGELTVISAQNMDYSSPEEIEERVSKAIAEGLEVCKEF